MADKNAETELPDVKVRALLGIYHDDGLQVVFDIMEEICNRSENDFLGTHPSDKEQVLAQHAILHAQRAFFQDVTQKIDMIATEKLNITPKPRESRHYNQILSALPDVEG